MMAGGAGCALCTRIRWFLMIALFLVVAIYLQPAWVLRLAGHMPNPTVIGAGIVVAGGAVFARRLHLHLRGR